MYKLKFVINASILLSWLLLIPVVAKSLDHPKVKDEGNNVNSEMMVPEGALSNVNWVDQPHIKVALVSNYTQLKVGQNFHLGFLLTPESGWHVYWQNPGDTGLAPKVDWDSAADFSTGEIQWPLPEAIPVAHLMNYGYHNQVLLPIPAQVLNDDVGSQKVLSAKFDWLVCRESCIPGSAELSTTVHIGEQAKPSNQYDLLAESTRRLPAETAVMAASFEVDSDIVNGEVYFQAPIFKSATTVQLFPISRDLVAYNQPANLRWKHNFLKWQQPVNEYFTEISTPSEWLVVVDGNQGFRFRATAK